MWGNAKSRISAAKPSFTGSALSSSTAQKRAVSAGPLNSGLVKKATSSGPAPSLTVTSQSKRKEVGIETLLGDYAEKGYNHGQKYYQKIEKIAGHEDVAVFLYYWDKRDGPDFTGWWFGDEIGGSQVWARCIAHGSTPPRVGWRIPWDAAKPEPGILCVDVYSGDLRDNASSAASFSSVGAGPAAKLRQATEMVTKAEAAAQDAVNKAKKLLTGQPAVEKLLEVQTSLQEQQTALNDAQKSLGQEMIESRKGGPSSALASSELQKLAPKLRTAQASVTAELMKIKQAAQKASQGKRVAEAQAKQKEQEVKDKKSFEAALPEAQDIVKGVEETVDGVEIMASPLIAEAPEDVGATLTRALGEIESAAAEAQARMNEARAHVNSKLTGAREYAPETRKTALNEFSALQLKLTEAQKKLNPYKTYKKEFFTRLEARKALTSLVDKLAELELEVEKATMMSTAADQGQMAEEEVKAAQELVTPAQKGMTTAIQQLEQKLRTTTGGVMKEEINGLIKRAKQGQQKIIEVNTVLSQQQEGLTTQHMLVLAAEKVDQIDAQLLKCQEAEMPFLKGLEVLPPDESTKAISDCESQSSKADSLIKFAKNFMTAKLVEVKRFSKDVSKKATEELNAQQSRLEAVATKVAAFKKETSERKTAAILAGLVEAVTLAEKKVKELAEVASIFSEDSVERASIEALKEAGENSKSLDKAATAACLEARKIMTAKQKENKTPDGVASLTKLNGRLNTTQQELAKHKKAASNCEKLVKTKEAMVQEELKIKESEAQMDNAEALAKPQGDEKLSDETIEELDTALSTASKTAKAAQRAVEAHLPGALQETKGSLQKLVDRCKKVVTKSQAVRNSLKEDTERVLSQAFVREGKKKCDEVEAALERVGNAELPFLKGIEVLPLEEARETITNSEAAANEVQAAINAARTYIASKNLELRNFDEKLSKPASEQLAELTVQINSAVQKLTQFRKDTDSRKKTAHVQEAGEKVSVAEEQVKKTAETAGQLSSEESEDLSENASEVCEKLAAIEKETQIKMNDARSFLTTKLKDMRTSPTHIEALQKLQARIADAAVELAKAKSVSRDHQQKFTAKAIMSEANEVLKAAEDEMTKITAACATILEQRGEEFLVSASLQRLAAVLRDSMEGKEMSEESLYESVKGSSAAISAQAFDAYLEKLPGESQREEIAFSPERRAAMFKQLDTDGTSSLSLDKFRALFEASYVCRNGISITDVFEISNSKTVGKAEVSEMWYAKSNPKKDESTGMTRILCKGKDNDKEGWITLKGNQGTVYLEPFTPFAAYSTDLAKKLDESAKAINRPSGFLKAKLMETRAGGAAGPLASVRDELTKLQPKATSLLQQIDALRKKVGTAQREYLLREKKEANAHIEAKEQKAADELLEVPLEKASALEACIKSLEDAVKPMVALDAPALKEFSSPASTLDESETLLEKLVAAAEQSKASAKGGLENVGKLTGTAMVDARKQLVKMTQKADEAATVAKRKVTILRGACSKIVEEKLSAASTLARDELREKGSSFEQLFEELVKGQERISKDSFCKYLTSMKGLTCNPEQAKLVFRRIEEGGISKRSFMKHLQKYYKVVKPIAVTPYFDIAKAKSTVKLDIDEIIDIHEGPQVDDKVGFTRIKGKSITSGKEGWITVKGNQGTPYLQEVEKPCYLCVADCALDSEFKEGSTIRTLKAEEIIELIEGPRKESMPSASRIRVKAVSDDAQGWCTVTDKRGASISELSKTHYTCTSSVAMTDELDIKNSNVVKKLPVGELLLLLEGPTEESAGISRIKVRSAVDNKEGWLTVKGNAGTVYAEKSSKHYTVLQETELHKEFPSDCSEVIRTLQSDELLIVLEGPKTEAFPPEIRVKGRAMSDGAAGWATVSPKNLRIWSPYYTCLQPSDLQATLQVADAEAVRSLAVGEVLELIDGPSADADSKLMRMKGRALKDGAIGWVTLKDSEGKKLFESKSK